jgi:hypothetical protein
MQDFNDFRKRFIEIKASLNLGNSDIGRICKVSPTAIRDLTEGNTKDFGVSKLLKLLDFKSELSAEWVMRGVGDITKSDDTEKSNYWKSRYNAILKENEKLFNDNEFLKERLGEQASLIKNLEGKKTKKGQ